MADTILNQNTRTVSSPAGIKSAVEWITSKTLKGLEGGKAVVWKIARPTRKEVLNSLMWVRLTQLARDGRLRGDKYNKDWWYAIMLQAYKNAGHWVPEWIIGVDGQPVVRGGSSTMSDPEIGGLIEFIEAYGVTEQDIKWAANPRHEQ